MLNMPRVPNICKTLSEVLSFSKHDTHP
jgi:hypothetical protein